MNTSKLDNTKTLKTVIHKRLLFDRMIPNYFRIEHLLALDYLTGKGVEQDGRKAVELDSTSMKAHYYLAQALLNLRHVGEAHKEALIAYKICLATRDSSAEVVSQFVLRAKQAVWQAKETSRLREMNDTLALVEDLLDQQLQRDLSDLEERFRRHEIGEMGKSEETEQLHIEAEERRRAIRAGFADPSKPETQERVVPDWMVDPITFEVMHDPVITPSGASYERVGLLKHIEQSGTDPLTREKLTQKQLIGNIGLKNACAEFLEKNGWAVDW